MKFSFVLLLASSLLAFAGGGGTIITPVGIGGSGGSITPAQIAAAGGLTNLSVGNTVYVDSINGSNGIRGRFDRPTLLISNAVALTQFGDTVNIHSGNYDDYYINRSNNINYYFEPGATLTYSNRTAPSGTTGKVLFGDIGGATNYVKGYGNFNITRDTTSDSDFSFVCDIKNSNTVFYLEGDSILQTSVYDLGGLVGGLVFEGGKDVSVKFNTIDWDDANADPNNGAAFTWYGGNVRAHIGKITAHGTVSCLVLFDPSDTKNRDVLDFHVDELIATNTTRNCIWWYGSLNTNQQEFLHISYMEAGAEAAVENFAGGGGKGYILDNAKTWNHSTNNPVISYQASEAQNQLWFSSQKVQDGGVGGVGAGFYCFTNTSNPGTNSGDMTFDVLEWVEYNTNYITGFQMFGGTHNFTGHKPIILPNGVGFYANNCKLILNNVFVDTSKCNYLTNNCVNVVSNSVVIINGGVFTTTNGITPIYATNAQTVYINGASLSGIVNTNVTVVGNYTVNGTPFHGNNPAQQIINTNLTAISSLTVTWPIAYRDTNYVAIAEGNGSAILNPQVTSKTLTQCTFTMTAFTGAFDIVAIH